MSVKATRYRRDMRRKEAALWDRNVIGANDLPEVDCPELCQVCAVLRLANSLEAEGWRVKVPPFELGHLPLLRVRATKKSRSNNQ